MACTGCGRSFYVITDATEVHVVVTIVGMALPAAVWHVIAAAESMLLWVSS
jgi:hypothetical protein